jgi:uncharacterized protein (TIGR02302 family)
MTERPPTGRKDPEITPDNARAALERPVFWTRVGLVAERAAQAFWPLWTVAGLALTAAAFEIPSRLGPDWGTGLAAAVGIAGLGTLARGIWTFRWPRRAEAEDRLDAATPGRPLRTLADRMAIGEGDPQARAVWRAHLRRIADAARAARPVRPDLRLARRDRYALRHIAATGVVMAVLFGTGWRSQDGLLPGAGGPALAIGPAWEGWAEPPSYTGRPSLYLNEITDGFTVPEGTRITLRLYGADGRLSVTESVSDDAGEARTDPAQELVVMRSGRLQVEGPGGRGYDVTVQPDNAPTITVDGPVSRVQGGEMRLPFSASDDFAVIGGEATFTLDLAATDRIYGLATPPEPREPLVVPIPLTLTGDRAEFTEVLAENFSEHPWANLPVRLEMTATDHLNQTGRSEPFAMELPGRRFFNPLAAAIIEQRRDLLWSRENAKRVWQVLKAVSWNPEGFITNETGATMLEAALMDLRAGLDNGLDPEARDAIAAALWDVALQFEEGSLDDARERLERAREALDEAMRRGASEDEIAELMQELREAMDDYMRQLAEQQRESGQEMAEADPNAQTMTGDQLQELLDQIEQLMREGRMDEAQALLDQLMQMMENMQVAEGQQGQQGQSPGEQAMEGLQDTLRQQQGLADDSFQQLQEGQQGQQGQPGQQGQGQLGQGQQPGQQGGQGQGQQPGEMTAEDLQRRQEALRGMLEQQRRNLPGAGTPEGDAAREALGRAGEAMDDAAEALGRGDLPDALDNQSEAIDALRDGMQNLGDMIAQEQQQGQQGQRGQAQNGQDPTEQRDPLGRENGNFGRLGTDEALLDGVDPQERAQELLDEIRRRSGEQERSEQELDYLRRLLDQF